MCQCCLKITQEYPAGEAMFTVFPSEHECLPIFAIIEGEPVAIVRIEAKHTTDIFPIPIQIQPVIFFSVVEPGPSASLT